jgi:hypothetical protein
MSHICELQHGAPIGFTNAKLGDVWECSCGNIYKYEMGFTEDDHYRSDWWLQNPPERTPADPWWKQLWELLTWRPA